MFIDPALAVLVPSDAVFLAGVRAEALQRSPVYRQYSQGRKNGWLELLAATTGLEPNDHLQELLISYDGQRWAALVRGKFAEGGLEPQLKRFGAQRAAYRGKLFFGDERRAVAFMNSSVAIAGSGEGVKRILDQHASGGGGIPARLEKQIARLPAHGHVWAVGDVGALPQLTFEKHGNLANLNHLSRKVQSVIAWLEVGEPVKLHLELESEKPEQAREAQAALLALIGLSRVGMPGQPRRNGLEQLSSSLQGRKVVVEAMFPPDVLKVWMQ